MFLLPLCLSVLAGPLSVSSRHWEDLRPSESTTKAKDNPHTHTHRDTQRDS
ncbi:Hypothetical protein FKW44_021275 [Caligus rogercresseyi]|uniref:Uncharacterized protein n=1 Tax=Caligus rogercresseyi TaxID=217165 RepID=A0A7T8JWA5_CALRO|nr:Hypothetical protein FKW44_021275 [Caligus rogercresseyi]